MTLGMGESLCKARQGDPTHKKRTEKRRQFKSRSSSGRRINLLKDLVSSEELKAGSGGVALQAEVKGRGVLKVRPRYPKGVLEARGWLQGLLSLFLKADPYRGPATHLVAHALPQG